MANETRVTVDLTVDVDEDELSLSADDLEDAVTELVAPGVSGELRLDVRRSRGESAEGTADEPADPANAVERSATADGPDPGELDGSDEPAASGEAPGSTGLADAVESADDGEETPGPAPEDPQTDETKAGFEVYEDRAGQFRWRLVHDNGNVIADSGEGYSTWAGAENGLRSVKRNAPGATVERL